TTGRLPLPSEQLGKGHETEPSFNCTSLPSGFLQVPRNDLGQLTHFWPFATQVQFLQVPPLVWEQEQHRAEYASDETRIAGAAEGEAEAEAEAEGAAEGEAEAEAEAE